MRTTAFFLLPFALLGVLALHTPSSFAQNEAATVSGRVTDSQGNVVIGVQIRVVNIETNILQTTKTNAEGLYVVSNLKPGSYRILVTKEGFKEIVKTGLVLHVQDIAAENFSLQVGSVSESVTVTADQLNINTTDASVSTIVDRQFVENLPLNGRSFQTLIQLTPGVVLTSGNYADGGQFSVNGQRAASNYWMVDGVSANIGVGSGTTPGNGLSGSLGSFSVLGGTNSLVSVDALQEFRIQSSTYSPEFGRTPGAQISIVTRSGTNQFHGTAFDYLRNDKLDANNWFNGFQNDPPLTKARERQNDFGGTLSGPLWKDHTFFFFSYEGLRLRLPQTALTTVPDADARLNAIPIMQPYLNAFPLDPSQPELGNGAAQFNSSYSDPASLDAYSLRVDHRLNEHLNVFGRYNYSPSSISQRGAGGMTALSTVQFSNITTQTGTVGATWLASPSITNDFRFNYSRTSSHSRLALDDFGGAIVPSSLPFPEGLTTADSQIYIQIFGLQQGYLASGQNQVNTQRQFNIVDGFSWQKGQHSLKFGADYRRLSPIYSPYALFEDVAFADVPSFASGNSEVGLLTASTGATFLFRDLGLYAQDTWRATPHFTVTYGVRWEIEFAPRSLQGPAFPAFTGFNLNDLSTLALAPDGTDAFKTTYGNFAPRIGAAYQLRQSVNWQTVLRAGFGVFYDMATSEFGNQLGLSYPYGAQNASYGAPFPFTGAAGAVPVVTRPSPTSPGNILALDPNLKLPYTLQWNIALEQSIGSQQTVSATYLGAAGRRLLRSANGIGPTPEFPVVQLVGNEGTSDYEALQIQFQRRMAHGLQALASYTWAHSLDDASAGSIGVYANLYSGGLPTRGSSDFDIRNAFSAALTYDIPGFKSEKMLNALTSGWSLDNIIQARSAAPVNVDSIQFPGGIFAYAHGNYFYYFQPDLVAGQALYLYGSQYPGGKAINPAAFTAPPIDPTTGQPTRNGNLGRNALRGFGMAQWDFAVHRDFALREWLRLQFRAEMFNVLNHPNFGQPDPVLSDPNFGISTKLLGQYLSGGSVGTGSFSPLYQVGGPRSIQLALKLTF